MVDLISRAERFTKRIAVRDVQGVYTYADLLSASASIAASLLDGQSNLGEARIAFLIKPSFKYVATHWGIWRAGGLAVPLCADHPLPALVYILHDAQVSQLIVDGDHFQDLLEEARESAIHFRQYDQLFGKSRLDLPSIHLEG